MYKIQQVCHFSSLFIIKTISRRAARRLVVLHSKHDIESELKWQTCFGVVPSKFYCSSGKGLKVQASSQFFQIALSSFEQTSV